MDLETAAWLIAKQHPHGVSRTRLMKLLWLAEQEHMSQAGERLTDASWFRWEHGPFSKDVLNTVEDNPHNFSEERISTADGDDATLVHAVSEQPGEVTNAEGEVLRRTVWKYDKHDFDDLLEEVYADPFFKATPHGQDFDFDALDGYRDLSHIPEEEIERAEEADGERYQSASAVFEDL
jgi:uncharacterized phage-associated protein